MNSTLSLKTTLFKTWKTKTAAAVAAVVLSVGLPQILHALGTVSGLGTGLGESFLPMHLAIIMVGLLAGPFAGLAAGIASPLISFAISDMPGMAMLPFITVELAAYGLVSGLLAKSKMHIFFKLLIVQAAGRTLRSVAVLIGAYAFSSVIPVSTIWMSILTGLPGILLQWAFIPLIMFWVEKKTSHE